MYYTEIHRDKGSGRGTPRQKNWEQLKQFLTTHSKTTEHYASASAGQRGKSSLLALYQLTLRSRTVAETSKQWSPTVWSGKHYYSEGKGQAPSPAWVGAKGPARGSAGPPPLPRCRGDLHWVNVVLVGQRKTRDTVQTMQQILWRKNQDNTGWRNLSVHYGRSYKAGRWE